MRHSADFKLDHLPDEATILKFRHYLENDALGQVLFEEANNYIKIRGLILREGNVINAIYLESSPIQNESSQQKARNAPDLKGHAWHFDMRFHVGVHDKLWLTRSTDTMFANAHNVVTADKLLHDEKQRFQ